MPALQTALREVQEDDGVLAQRVCLEEGGARHLELPLVVVADPLLEARPSHLRRRVVRALRQGGARGEGGNGAEGEEECEGEGAGLHGAYRRGQTAR